MDFESTELPVPPESPQPPQPRPERLGLAITALVLGIVSIPLSVLLMGGLAGLAGVIVALLHLRWRPEQRRGMAAGGLILSVVGLVASAGMGVVYYRAISGYLAMFADAENVQQWVGVESPDFTVKTMDGKTFKLSDYRGKRVIVDHWATWCGPCVREAPHFNQLRQTVSADDLAIVGISTEDESDLKSFLETHQVRYPIASAESLPGPFTDVLIIPTTFFIDRNGVIQSVLVGYKSFEVLREHATAADYKGEIKNSPVGGD